MKAYIRENKKTILIISTFLTIIIILSIIVNFLGTNNKVLVNSYITKLDKDVDIMNGDIYAVDTWSQGMIIRRIRDNKDGTWTCTPCDLDHFQPFNIDRTDVINVFRIVGVLITNIT